MQKKRFGNDFVVVEFHEHPIVDHSKQAVRLFDVSAKGYADFAPDFMMDGEFNHRQYCLCLLGIAFGLERRHFSSFLDYQCARVSEPYLWLIRFDCLLNNNSDHVFFEAHRSTLDRLIQLVEDKINMHSSYVTQHRPVAFNWMDMSSEEDNRFDIVAIKEELKSKLTLSAKKHFLLRRRTDFLQEVSYDVEASFIQQIDLEMSFLESTGDSIDAQSRHKRILFHGTPSQLSDLIFQLKTLKGKDGSLLFDGGTVTYARLICDYFCQSNGELYNESSIRKFLTNYNGGKRPRKEICTPPMLLIDNR